MQIWKYLDSEARLYFDSLHHVVNPDAIDDKRKLRAVEFWTEFWEALLSDGGHLFGSQDTQLILDGAALYRAGYYILQSERQNVGSRWAKLPGEPIRVEERDAGYEAANEQYRLMGLYKKENLAKSDPSCTVLHDVMTAAKLQRNLALMMAQFG